MKAYTELTLSSGDMEAMVHVTDGGKVTRAYVYTKDIPHYPRRWKFKKCRNSLFSDVAYPSPSSAKRVMHTMGMEACSSE